jgi:hypothetical protein
MPDEYNLRQQAAGTLLMDLDRCRHGRHEGDACNDCPGEISAGNPFLPAGGQIGFDISGRRIIVPPRGSKHDPAAWIDS